MIVSCFREIKWFEFSWFFCRLNRKCVIFRLYIRTNQNQTKSIRTVPTYTHFSYTVMDTLQSFHSCIFLVFFFVCCLCDRKSTAFVFVSLYSIKSLSISCITIIRHENSFFKFKTDRPLQHRLQFDLNLSVFFISSIRFCFYFWANQFEIYKSLHIRFIEINRLYNLNAHIFQSNIFQCKSHHLTNSSFIPFDIICFEKKTTAKFPPKLHLHLIFWLSLIFQWNLELIDHFDR